MRLDVFTLIPGAFAWLQERRPVAAVLGTELELRVLNYRDTTPLSAGQVDDNPSDVSGTCGDACPGGLLVNCVGQCKAGAAICQNGARVCSGAIGPSPERCDGVDNDCNGTIDDGLGDPWLNQACCPTGNLADCGNIGGRDVAHAARVGGGMTRTQCVTTTRPDPRPLAIVGRRVSILIHGVENCFAAAHNAAPFLKTPDFAFLKRLSGEAICHSLRPQQPLTG